ncbi:MAG: helix-turn-helix transcriptional regulator [Variovorax sp.]
MQDLLVMLDDLVLDDKRSHEKLAGMTIHENIKQARLAKGWSMERLAEEVSKAEGLSKVLAWQTVQQWEREGGTAPKRKRLDVVAKLLNLGAAQMISLAGSGDTRTEGAAALTTGKPGAPGSISPYPSHEDTLLALTVISSAYEKCSALTLAQIRPLFAMLFGGAERRGLAPVTISQRISELLSSDPVRQLSKQDGAEPASTAHPDVKAEPGSAPRS